MLIQINEKSWHARIVLSTSEARSERIDNLCQYVRALVFGILLISITVVVGLFVLSSIAHGAAWIVAMLRVGHYFFPDDVSIVAFVVLMVLSLAITAGCAVGFVVEHWKAVRPRQDSLLVATWRSWQEKICIPIKWV